MEDKDVWKKYPDSHRWFNKLYISELMGYECGPCGVAPERSDYYIVRPIYNLSGMSAGASKMFISSGDMTKVQPGYFWCEWFEGKHYSVTYELNNGEYKVKSCWVGEKKDLKFLKWIRSDYSPTFPSDIKIEYPIVNIEFIGDNLIEIHLRDTPDPDYDEIIPIWENDSTSKMSYYELMGYKFIKSYDNADGFIKTARKGFMVK